MIKANELRIFNKVDTENGIATIQEIDTVNVEVFFGEYPDENTKVYKHNEINPISLTEEWLRKFGWNDLFDSSTPEERDRPFSGYIENGVFHYELWHDMDTVHTIVKNVHSLQNLHFALTGEELTIK